MSIHKLYRNDGRSRVSIITRVDEAKMVSLLNNGTCSNRKEYFPDVADLVEVLVDTGMRLSEALELRYADVKFDDNLIAVRMGMSYKCRRVPMTKRVAAILKRRQEITQHKPFNLTAYQIERAWAWARAQIWVNGNPSLVLYSLRRTCACRLVSAGVALDIVEEWLLCNRKKGYRRLAPLTSHLLTKAAEMLENSANTEL